MEETSAVATIQIVNGKPSVTSLQVAAAFNREHFNVLNDIRKTVDKCSDSFNALNFKAVEYEDAKGEKRPMYVLSKDGLLMVTMGYTTPEAAHSAIAFGVVGGLLILRLVPTFHIRGVHGF